MPKTMAPKRSAVADLPDLTTPANGDLAAAEANPDSSGPDEVKIDDPATPHTIRVTLELPILHPGPHDYVGRQINAKLTQDQADVFRAISNGLSARFPRAPGSSSAARDAATLRFLLEQIVNQLEVD